MAIKRKLARGPFRDHKFVIEPPGQIKMSDVLLDFVAPYRHFVNTIEAYRKLLLVAVIAWNAALLPECEQ